MNRGIVYLIGAGPGSPDLLTARALRCLRRADLVLCDRLLPPGFFDELDLPGETVVRRLGEDESLTKPEGVCEAMASAAELGQRVARLKTGDPGVFGRAAEEIAFLAGRGVSWEIVPGVSASQAASAEASLPLTRRGRGRSFAVVSARQSDGLVPEALPRADSLVIYMGVAVLAEVTERLLSGGWAAETPAALIERAAQPWGRCVRGPLGRLAELASAWNVSAPAIVMVGPAAEGLAARDARPTVLFTGLDPGNFRTLGNLVHWPALQVVPEPAGVEAAPRAIERLAKGGYDDAIFTSRVGVTALHQAVRKAGRDARIFSNVRILPAGAGTAGQLDAWGLRADAVPQVGGTEGILDVLGEPAGRRILLVQGTHAPAGLQGRLAAAGAEVYRLAMHRIQAHPELGRPLPPHDVAYFISPSGVRAWHDAYGPAGFAARLWCIGEATGEQLRKLGHQAKIVDPHDESRNPPWTMPTE